MDDIRAKRIAKLGASSATNKSTSSTKSDASTITTSARSSSSSTSLPLGVSNSTSQQPPPSKQPPIFKPSTSTIASSKENEKKKLQLSPEDYMNQWITKVVEQILQVTLDLDNSDCQFLESLHTELVSNDKDIVMNKDLLNEAITERLLEIGHENPFRYLKDSFAKTSKYKATISAKDSYKVQKFDFLNELERLTVSYGLVSFQIPDFFLNGDLVMYLRDIIQDISSYSDFLSHIIEKSNQEDTLLEFLNSFVPTLFCLFPNMSLNNPQYPLIINTFEFLLSEKIVASKFTQIDGFAIKNPNQKPSTFENETLLGRLFTLSPLQSVVACENLKPEANMTQTANVVKSLQSEHSTIVDRLYQIADKIVRGSETSRNDLLKYFATIVNKNHLRRGDHSDFKKLSSDAFMTNITLVLIGLSEPFMEPSYKKLDRIDPLYFAKSSLIDISNETRFNSTIPESDEFFKNNRFGGKPNFVSDCFYLTTAYLHYGIGGTLLHQHKLEQEIKFSTDRIKELRAKMGNTTMTKAITTLYKAQLVKLEERTATLKSCDLAVRLFFTNQPMQVKVFDFIAGSSAFLTRLVDPTHKYPHGELKLPFIPDVIGVENADNTEYFREKSPAPFKHLPEFLLEGLINYIRYLSKFEANPLIGNRALPTYVQFAVVFLRCPELISNPHLKGRLLESLFFGSLSPGDGKFGYMTEIFDTDKIVLDHLLYALLDFYVAVEKTGSSTQYYDKFNSRYHISVILKYLWKNVHYQNQLIYQSNNNEEFFIRFIARMLNDLTYLLDESLKHLAEVHSIQNELKSRAEGITTLEDVSDEELQRRLSGEESQARSNVQLANKSIDLFGLFTKEVPKAFIKPEIVGRLAGMLDYNLEALAGEKSKELKVKDPEKYSFNPRELLPSITQVYLNLCQETEFIKAVADDARSFRRPTFAKAERILSRWHLLPEPQIKAFVKFADQAESKRLETEEEELELGDVPDEFLDPLMYTIMKDPVILPSSRTNIDRSTIRTHLLNDSNDPFNRMPLKYEDVVPNHELRAQIQKFLKKNKLSEDQIMTDI